MIIGSGFDFVGAGEEGADAIAIIGSAFDGAVTKERDGNIAGDGDGGVGGELTTIIVERADIKVFEAANGEWAFPGIIGVFLDSALGGGITATTAWSGG